MLTHISRFLRTTFVVCFVCAVAILALSLPALAQSPDEADAVHPYCRISPYCGNAYNPLPIFIEGVNERAVAPASGEATEDWTLATWSRLAGSVDVGDNWELWVSYGDYSGQHLIAQSPGNDIAPRMAPGAQKIVFVSDRDSLAMPVGKRIYQLYVVNTEGTNLRKVLDLPVSQFDPVWSPDGTQILFHMEIDGNRDLYLVNEDGSNLTRITTDPAPDLTPTWARKTNKIAWVRHTSATTGSLMTADADGTNEAVIVADMPYLERPELNPAGDRVAFTGRYNPDQYTSNQALVLKFAPGSQIQTLHNCSPASWCRMGGWSDGVGSWWTGPLDNANTLMVNIVDYTGLDLKKLSMIATYNFFGWADLRRVYYPEHPELGHHGIGVETEPPQFSVTAPPAYVRNGVSIPLTAVDVGPSGIAFGEYEIASDGARPAWKRLEIFHPVRGLATGLGEPGAPQKLRFHMLDFAGNISDWSEWFRYTIFQNEGFFGITDNRGVPLEGATAVGGKYAFGLAPADAAGTIHYYSIDRTSEEPVVAHIREVDSGSAGKIAPLDFAPYEVARWTSPNDFVRESVGRTYLAPNAPNPVVNGDFETGQGAGLANGWVMGGSTRHLNTFTASPTWNLWLGDTLKQTIPAEGWESMHEPTLSFLYIHAVSSSHPGGSINGTEIVPGRPFEVAIVDMTTFTRTVVFTDTNISARPQVGWIDLTPWQGNAIRVEFGYDNDYVFTNLPEGLIEDSGVVILDRVKIAPWTTPVITAVAPVTETLAAGSDAQAKWRLTVENLLGAPKVTVGGVNVNVTRIDESTLEIDAAGAPPGNQRVCAIHSSGMYSCAADRIQVGELVWLPLVQ